MQQSALFFQNSRKSRKTPKSKRGGGQSLSSSAEQARFTLTGHVILHNVDVRTCITTSTSFFGLFSISVPLSSHSVHEMKGFSHGVEGCGLSLDALCGSSTQVPPPHSNGVKSFYCSFFSFFLKGDRSGWRYHQHFVSFIKKGDNSFKKR